jgi:ribosomal protein S2
MKEMGGMMLNPKTVKINFKTLQQLKMFKTSKIPKKNSKKSFKT